MEAEINIGELNICVNCGELKITAAIDNDGLPLCDECYESERSAYDDWRWFQSHQ